SVPRRQAHDHARRPPDPYWRRFRTCARGENRETTGCEGAAGPAALAELAAAVGGFAAHALADDPMVLAFVSCSALRQAGRETSRAVLARSMEPARKLGPCTCDASAAGQGWSTMPIRMIEGPAHGLSVRFTIGTLVTDLAQQRGMQESFVARGFT